MEYCEHRNLQTLLMNVSFGVDDNKSMILILRNVPIHFSCTVSVVVITHQNHLTDTTDNKSRCFLSERGGGQVLTVNSTSRVEG